MQNQLIAVSSTNVGDRTIQTCNARDLHSFLESKQEFANWIKARIDQYGFVEGEDYLIDKIINNPQGGRPVIEYHLSLDMGKELGMVERSAKGREIRKYFIACEAAASQPTIKVSVPRKPRLTGIQSKVAALLLIEQSMAGIPGVRVETLKCQTLDAIETSTGLATRLMARALPSPAVDEATRLNATQVGEPLGVSAKNANLLMADHGLVVRREGKWHLTQAGLEYGELKPYTRNGHSDYEIRWSAKVVDFLKARIA